MSDLHAAIEHFENSPALRREFAYTLQAMKDARDALEQAQEQYLSWKPTAENINALPIPLFEYVCHIETLCDPAGMVAENTLLKDQTKQLDAMIGGLKARIEQLEAAIQGAICRLDDVDGTSLVSYDLENVLQTAGDCDEAVAVGPNATGANALIVEDPGNG